MEEIQFKEKYNPFPSPFGICDEIILNIAVIPCVFLEMNAILRFVS